MRSERTVTEATILDEEAHLLRGSVHLQQARSARTPLPKLPLLALCALRFAEPIVFAHIFPYVNEMIAGLGVTDDEAKIGFYSGAVESVFSVAQVCSIYHWAKASAEQTSVPYPRSPSQACSDTVGRRPVLFLGTLGFAGASLMFGLSRTLAGLLISRSISGFFSGAVSVSQSVLGDITDASNQAIAYPMFSLIFQLGYILEYPFRNAPPPDSLLTRGICDTGPSSAARSRIPRNDTAAGLPPRSGAAIATGITVLAVAFSYFALTETVKPAGTLQHDPRNKSQPSYDSVLATESTSAVPQEPPPGAVVPQNARQLLSQPLIGSVCVAGFSLSFVGTAFMVLFVLFCFSPISAGGLALPPSYIGYALSAAGATSGVAQLLLMPALLSRCNIAQLHTWLMAGWPLAYATMPCLNIALRQNAPAWVFWSGFAIILLASEAGWLSCSAETILVKHSAPASHLGRTNGLFQLFQSLARAFAPALVSTLYAATARSPVLGGHTCALVMVALSVLGWMSARNVQRVHHLHDRRSG